MFKKNWHGCGYEDFHDNFGLVKKGDQAILNNIRQQIEKEGKFAHNLAFQYYDTNTPLREPSRAWLEKHGYRIITVPAMPRRGHRCPVLPFSR